MTKTIEIEPCAFCLEEGKTVYPDISPIGDSVEVVCPNCDSYNMVDECEDFNVFNLLKLWGKTQRERKYDAAKTSVIEYYPTIKKIFNTLDDSLQKYDDILIELCPSIKIDYPDFYTRYFACHSGGLFKERVQEFIYGDAATGLEEVDKLDNKEYISSIKQLEVDLGRYSDAISKMTGLMGLYNDSFIALLPPDDEYLANRNYNDELLFLDENDELIVADKNRLEELKK